MSEPAAIAKPPVTLRLDLASGQNVRDGYEGVDIWPGSAHVVDLQQYPWPFPDESVLELNCSHYIEHIPMEYVTSQAPAGPCDCGKPPLHGEGGMLPIGDGEDRCLSCMRVFKRPKKDSLFAFFDECYRILVPGGWMHIAVPAHRSDRAFQDPTHRRFITAQTFAYLSEQVRRDWRIDHYEVDCNFIGGCDPVVDASINLRAVEVAQRMIQRDWNTVIDWSAKIQKAPRLPPKVQ
jgi:hypothetical protein